MRGIGVPSTRDQRSRKEKEQVENVKLLLNHSSVTLHLEMCHAWHSDTNELWIFNTTQMLSLYLGLFKLRTPEVRHL
ncbi:MAG: hypothetical protein AAF573_17935 [Bacteroidota bacterium]